MICALNQIINVIFLRLEKDKVEHFHRVCKEHGVSFNSGYIAALFYATTRHFKVKDGKKLGMIVPINIRRYLKGVKKDQFGIFLSIEVSSTFSFVASYMINRISKGKQIQKMGKSLFYLSHSLFCFFRVWDIAQYYQKQIHTNIFSTILAGFRWVSGMCFVFSYHFIYKLFFGER